MAHAGLEISSQTLWDQCWAATRLLEPVYDALFQRLRAGPVIGVDQTGWPDLEDKSLPPWQMWCITAPGIVYHRICDDKSAATFKALLGDYRGWVVADALGTHEAGARECRGIKTGHVLGARAPSLPRRRSSTFRRRSSCSPGLGICIGSTTRPPRTKSVAGCASPSRGRCSRRCATGFSPPASRRRPASAARSATP